MSNLIEYYRIRQSTDKALERYLKLVKERHWDIGGQGGKLHLYSLATQAFDSPNARSESLEAFRAVYDAVLNWRGVQRGGHGFASAESVFEVLVGAGHNFIYGSGVSLVNLTYRSPAASGLDEFLPKLQRLKEMSGYPHMAVSKVLHFANPGLFPLWDTEVMWNTVMHGVFRSEYKQFCRDRRFRISENPSRFVAYYTLWAAQYIQQMDKEFMDWFVDWMDREYSDDLTKYGIRQELHRFYATAFEFVAIGAAYLELGDAAD